MKFEEVLPALRERKEIKRKNWKSYLSYFATDNDIDVLNLNDVLADDWEIVDESN